VWFAKRVGVIGKYINGMANYSTARPSRSSSKLVDQSINQPVDQTINQYLDIVASHAE